MTFDGLSERCSASSDAADVCECNGLKVLAVGSGLKRGCFSNILLNGMTDSPFGERSCDLSL
jgi:hypothetical protein